MGLRPWILVTIFLDGDLTASEVGAAIAINQLPSLFPNKKISVAHNPNRDVDRCDWARSSLCAFVCTRHEKLYALFRVYDTRPINTWPHDLDVQIRSNHRFRVWDALSRATRGLLRLILGLKLQWSSSATYAGSCPSTALVLDSVSLSDDCYHGQIEI